MQNLEPRVTMKPPARKGYRGNDCSPATPPIVLPRVPPFDRIRRFCSLEPQIPTTQPTIQPRSSSTDANHRHPHLPLLGDLHKYGVDANRRKRLWELEIRRLQLLNSSAEEALKPDIEKNDTFLGAKIEGNIFDDLAALATKIRQALLTCIVDDAVEVKRFSKATFPSAENYFQALLRLAQRDHEPVIPGLRPMEVYMNENGQWRSVTTERYVERYVDVERPSNGVEIDNCSPPDFRSKRVVSNNFHYMVDQITATIAQVAIRVSESEYWLIIVLGCLAKLATKMKIIHSNFFEFIDISVSGARHCDLSPTEQDSTMNDDSPIVERHVREHITVSSWLAQCIIAILDNLGDQKPWWKQDGFIDSCTLAFDTGVKPARTILCQNNHGRLSGSSDKIAVSFSSVALESVWKLSDMITSKTLNTYPEGIAHQPSGSFIDLHLDLEESLEGKSRRSSLSSPTRLYGIIDYITLIIPLSLTDPLVGEGYQNTLQVISSLSAFGVPNTRQIQIHGFVALKLHNELAFRASSKSELSSPVIDVSGIEKSGQGRKDKFATSSSLLESFLLSKRQSLLVRRNNLEAENLRTEGILARLMYKLHHVDKSRDEISEISRNWTIQEKSIVVPCPKYVICVAFLTIVLVAGGMACAFIVGERIPGVDPFNLTNFSWLVGGLSILVAKSMRVSDWTWRDFLSGRVSCRTVQELSDVTGLDPQDILFFLLSTETYGILLTGGPFQSAFCRAPDFDGFSIDVKPNLQTLLASGIVLVDVLTLEGPVLLWLRLVPGSPGTKKVLPSCAGYNGVLQVCKDPPQARGDGDAIITFSEGLRWIKVLGLYNLNGIEFR